MTETYKSTVFEINIDFLKELIEKRKDCLENGTYHGYNKIPHGKEVKHIGPVLPWSSANGINYMKCEYCTDNYQTKWNQKDYERFQEMMNTRFTI